MNNLVEIERDPAPILPSYAGVTLRIPRLRVALG
jgi:hypothetical protein